MRLARCVAAALAAALAGSGAADAAAVARVIVIENAGLSASGANGVAAAVAAAAAASVASPPAFELLPAALGEISHPWELRFVLCVCLSCFLSPSAPEAAKEEASHQTRFHESKSQLCH